MSVRSIISIYFLLAICSTTLDAQVQNPKQLPWEWRTDTTIRTADLSEIIVVLPKGAFPVLNFPEFEGEQDGRAEYLASEPVISVELDGEAKAYPLNVLTSHEISNDSLADIPILVTYCPLCNSGLVFDRRLKFKGKQFLLDFEVSGMLRKSDMVMYDKQTESWWQQISGQSIAGQLAGAELELIPSLIISVDEFFNAYPDGMIMSKETKYEEFYDFYGTNPYKKYDDPSNKPHHPYIDTTTLDPRLPPMERILNIEAGGKYKAYPFSVISEKGVINDSFMGKEIVIFHQYGTISVLDEHEIKNSRDIGSATAFDAFLEGRKLTFEKDGECFRDNQSGSCWDITGRCTEGRFKGKQLKILAHGNHFAFAWLAFHPETVIYEE